MQKPRRRVVVASVGHSADHVYRAVARAGLGPGDSLILVNSLPRSPAAVEAMKGIGEAVARSFEGVEVAELWLDPKEKFAWSVARIRGEVERRAPCRAAFLGVGGFRWLVIALWYAALALNTVAHYADVALDPFTTVLEEEPGSLVPEAYPTLEERSITIPVYCRLAELSIEDIKALKAVASGAQTIKEIQELLGAPQSTLQQRLARLARKGLLAYTRTGKKYRYHLTDLAVMIAGQPPATT